MQAVREKGASGWDLFCTQFDPMIKSITRWPKWKFSEHEQQDVCQNIYVQLQTALPSVKQQSSLSRFIKVIAMRQCVNEIRRQIRWRGVMVSSVQKTSDGEWNELEFANPDALDPHHEMVRKERRENLRLALQKLNKTCMESINLYYLKHLSYREISDQLGIAVNTVGSRLVKCLYKLHKDLRQHPMFKRTEP